MFSDMFDTPEQILTGQKQGAVQTSWDRQPRNCAALLEMPDLAKKIGYPIGLKNQGATCYLNSLLQVLFYTPELRKIVLELPLCDGAVDKPSDFVSPAKRSFLLAFQRLFSEMSLVNLSSMPTDYMKAAFGWDNLQHFEQQDINEAMKVILDTIQRALHQTVFANTMDNLFRGVSIRYKCCKVCHTSKQHLESFVDLSLQVKKCKSVNQAMENMLLAENMQGDNQVYCECCDAKCDMLLGTRLKEIPSLLVLTLNRFEFDYDRMERVKINSYLEYDLECEFGQYVTKNELGAAAGAAAGAEGAGTDSLRYELYGVIIHRGSAFGGHYLCYVRDVMKEADWLKSVKESQIQLSKQETGLTPQSQLTQQQRKRRAELAKQNKLFELKQPQNKGLLEGWFEIDDSIVKGIQAEKITTKYEGSQSAYMLFYRRAGSWNNIGEGEKGKVKVPEYFAKEIQDRNSTLTQLRETYELERQHIILKIDGVEHKLHIKTTINTLLELFVLVNHTMVMKSIHNNLPYYPLQFQNNPNNIIQVIQSESQQTIQTHNLIHQSQWITYNLQNPFYLQTIQPTIGPTRLPFNYNLLTIDNNTKQIAYQDETLLMLRIRLQKLCNIVYEKQIIKLITPYKEIILTDDAGNDEILLIKLGFCQECQVIIRVFEGVEGGDGEKVDDVELKDSNLLCFVVERDDLIGVKRMYVDKKKTLGAFLEELIVGEGLIGQKRRLRKLNGNRIFYQDHYGQSLGELGLEDEIIKLRLERGQIPIKGDICVKAKIQSLLYVGDKTLIEGVYDPNTIVGQLKKKLCEQLGVDVEMHKFYLTDWMGEPVRSLTREKLTIFQSNFGRQQVVCLRDINSPIGNELVHLQVYITQTGSPDNISKDGIYLKIEQFKIVLQFKQLLLTIEPFKSLQLTIKKLRIRQIKRDYMFGQIWRQHNKQIKNMINGSNKVVVQIMIQDEQLNEQQIVLMLKQRDINGRKYGIGIEMIFDGGKIPSVGMLREAVKEKMGIVGDVRLAKYFNYDFEWVEISQQSIGEYAVKLEQEMENKRNKRIKKDGKKKNEEKEGEKGSKMKKDCEENKGEIEEGKEKGKGKGKGKGKDKGKEKGKEKRKEEGKEEDKDKEVNNENEKDKQVQLAKTEQKSKPIKTASQTTQASSTVQASTDDKPQQDQSQPSQSSQPETQSKPNQQKAKEAKPKKQKAQKPQSQNQGQKKPAADLLADCLNLRKSPTLLKDGDWIGFCKGEIFGNDDWETDQDLSLRMLKNENKKGTVKHRANDNGKGFKINLDF